MSLYLGWALSKRPGIGPLGLHGPGNVGELFWGGIKLQSSKKFAASFRGCLLHHARVSFAPGSICTGIYQLTPQTLPKNILLDSYPAWRILVLDERSTE